MGYVTLWSGSGTINSNNTGQGAGKDMTIWYERRNNMYAIKGYSYYSDGGGGHVGPQSTVRWITTDVRVRLTYGSKTLILTTTPQVIGNPGDFINYNVYIETYVDPPTIPSSISTKPSSVQEGSTVSISWGSSSVSSGSITYYLERSINGGAYSQVYSGSLRSRTETALSTWNTVSYRVRAYSNGDYSGYRTSSTTTVTHNTAPTTPSSITVPELKSGKPATISWGSSTDSDGDTINYYLERSVDGGAYTVIRSGGTTTSYLDTPDKSWSTVIYRVRAYDGQAYSSYRTSSTITVKHFPEMKLKVDGTLKTSEDGWVKVDGVLRKIDGIWVRTNGILKEV